MTIDKAMIANANYKVDIEKKISPNVISLAPSTFTHSTREYQNLSAGQ